MYLGPPSNSFQTSPQYAFLPASCPHSFTKEYPTESISIDSMHICAGSPSTGAWVTYGGPYTLRKQTLSSPAAINYLS